MPDIRDKFFDELSARLESAGILAIVKKSHPANGKVIKLEGIALFKKLTVPNPFKNQGVAIHRRLNDTAIMQVGGKRIKAKNDWISAPLHSGNYSIMMDILFLLADRTNASRNTTMRSARKRMKAMPSEPKPIPKPVPGKIKAPKKKSKVKRKNELTKHVDGMTNEEIEDEAIKQQSYDKDGI